MLSVIDKEGGRMSEFTVGFVAVLSILGKWIGVILDIVIIVLLIKVLKKLG